MNQIKKILKNIPNIENLSPQECKDLITQLDVFICANGKTIPRGYPNTFLSNTANSCAIDSILFILFFTKGSFFMNKIYSNPNSEFERGKKIRQTILPVLDTLYTDCSKWIETALLFQRKISSFLRITGCNDIKSGTEIWNVLCEAFMGLQFDYLSEHAKMIGNKPIKTSYLLPDSDDDPFQISNSDIKPEFLVYGDDKPPKNQDRRPIYDMEIEEYELQAVLFYKPGHYTCCVKVFTEWVYYDDLMPTIRRLKSPEDFIFKESTNKKCQMLFYTLRL